MDCSFEGGAASAAVSLQNAISLMAEEVRDRSVFSSAACAAECENSSDFPTEGRQCYLEVDAEGRYFCRPGFTCKVKPHTSVAENPRHTYFYRDSFACAGSREPYLHFSDTQRVSSPCRRIGGLHSQHVSRGQRFHPPSDMCLSDSS